MHQHVYYCYVLSLHNNFVFSAWSRHLGSAQVTFYHVYFADVDGIAQWTEYSWTLEAPKTAKEMLQIDTWRARRQGPTEVFRAKAKGYKAVPQLAAAKLVAGGLW